MIPKRNAFPMPGNGAKVATAQPPPESSSDLVGEAVSLEVMPSVASLDTAAPSPPEPPRPKTAGRSGVAVIQFSEVAVRTMILTLENCLNPKVTFSEDVNLMRAEAHRQREEGLRKVLAALKAPA